MSRRLRLIPLLYVLAGAIAGAGLWRCQPAGDAGRGSGARDHGSATRDADSAGPGAEVAGTAEVAAADRDRATREREIAFYEERLPRDPQGALDLAKLAGLYLQRAREIADHEDFHRAESAARRSIANSSRGADRTYLVLAASLAGQHRFVEALAVAETLCAIEPQVPTYRAALGEIQLELGDYPGADSTFANLAGARNDLTVAPRFARWLEINGRGEEALALLIAARDEAVRLGDTPREALAWFHLRVGDLLARSGRVEDAERSYRAGLEARPWDHRLHVAMSKLALCRQRWQEAQDHARRAADAAPEPGTLVLVGDAREKLGDSTGAEEVYRTAEKEAKRRHGEGDRAWNAFLLDHDRSVSRVAALLRKDSKTRRDVHGYDLLAWALYKQGDYTGAREAMSEALRTGYRDGLFLFHAGMIDHARRADEGARRYLEQALAVNPYFHPTYPALARAVLDSLGGKTGG